MEFEFYHSGIKGQKWGLRRFQNPDGSLTPAGRVRYGLKSASSDSKKPHPAASKTGKQSSKEARKSARMEQKAAKVAAKDARKVQKEKDDALNRELQRYEALRRKPAKQLSEAEIKELSSRLQMEKSYKDLLRQAEDPKLFDAKKFAVDILQTSGKTIITGLITYGVGTAINNAANAKVINVGGQWKPQADNKNEKNKTK